MIIQHIRKGKKLIGTLVALSVEQCKVANNAGENFNIGYSLCNHKAGEKFDRHRGSDIAIGRAILNPLFNSVPSPTTVPGVFNLQHNYPPPGIQGHVKRFRQRCHRYFKETVEAVAVSEFTIH